MTIQKNIHYNETSAVKMYKYINFPVVAADWAALTLPNHGFLLLEENSCFKSFAAKNFII